ncbi:hypothetical protein BS47DRAFT_1338883 [Hydnum rufescens UP504]|uniref:Uncharacterized protein n=1 Tax=Hydnum rufescens UP504 TaxID=1448309 RepID=A0A9P6DX02_9AGAM|nr:hypothetical protein BS47DRAFT_1338883 [Hydnum rufescens UP504]
MAYNDLRMIAGSALPPSYYKYLLCSMSGSLVLRLPKARPQATPRTSARILCNYQHLFPAGDDLTVQFNGNNAPLTVVPFNGDNFAQHWRIIAALPVPPQLPATIVPQLALDLQAIPAAPAGAAAAPQPWTFNNVVAPPTGIMYVLLCIYRLWSKIN